jgi:hypothetical protein
MATSQAKNRSDKSKIRRQKLFQKTAGLSKRERLSEFRKYARRHAIKSPWHNKIGRTQSQAVKSYFDTLVIDFNISLQRNKTEIIIRRGKAFDDMMDVIIAAYEENTDTIGRLVFSLAASLNISPTTVYNYLTIAGLYTPGWLKTLTEKDIKNIVKMSKELSSVKLGFIYDLQPRFIQIVLLRHKWMAKEFGDVESV